MLKLRCKVRIKLALDASVKHWEVNVRRAREERLGMVHIDADRCALCVTCADIAGVGKRCAICPVSQDTGYDGCAGSPYQKVYDSLLADRFDPTQVIQAAEAELAYLKKLQKEMDMDV